jgi:hypothetical protein
VATPVAYPTCDTRSPVLLSCSLRSDITCCSASSILPGRASLATARCEAGFPGLSVPPAVKQKAPGGPQATGGGHVSRWEQPRPAGRRGSYLGRSPGHLLEREHALDAFRADVPGGCTSGRAAAGFGLPAGQHEPAEACSSRRVMTGKRTLAESIPHLRGEVQLTVLNEACRGWIRGSRPPPLSDWLPRRRDPEVGFRGTQADAL